MEDYSLTDSHRKDWVWMGLFRYLTSRDSFDLWQLLSFSSEVGFLAFSWLSVSALIFRHVSFMCSFFLFFGLSYFSASCRFLENNKLVITCLLGLVCLLLDCPGINYWEGMVDGLKLGWWGLSRHFMDYCVVGTCAFLCGFGCSSIIILLSDLVINHYMGIFTFQSLLSFINQLSPLASFSVFLVSFFLHFVTWWSKDYWLTVWDGGEFNGTRDSQGNS